MGRGCSLSPVWCLSLWMVASQAREASVLQPVVLTTACAGHSYSRLLLSLWLTKTQATSVVLALWLCLRIFPQRVGRATSPPDMHACMHASIIPSNASHWSLDICMQAVVPVLLEGCVRACVHGCINALCSGPSGPSLAEDAVKKAGHLLIYAAQPERAMLSKEANLCSYIY